TIDEPAVGANGTPPALPERRRRRRRRLGIAGAGAAVLAAAVAAVVAFTGAGDATKPPLEAESAIALDHSGRIVASVPVGPGPMRPAVAADGVWTIGDDGYLSRVDPETKQVVRRIYLGTELADLAVGDDSVWVTNGSEGSLEKISADRRVDTIPLRNGP